MFLLTGLASFSMLSSSNVLHFFFIFFFISVHCNIFDYFFTLLVASWNSIDPNLLFDLCLLWVDAKSSDP